MWIKRSPLIELESGLGLDFLCSNGGGGDDSSSNTTQTIQKSDPWEGQKGPLQQGYRWAEQAALATPTTVYQGNLLAPVTDAQRGLNTQQAAVGANIAGSAQPLLTAGTAALGNMGNRLGPAPNTSNIQQNPQAMSAIQASIDPVMRGFREQVLPNIGSEAVRSGAWGGTDHLKAQTFAGERATQQATEAASKLALPLYAQERQNQTDLQKQIDALNMSMSARELQMAPQLTQQGNQQALEGLGLQQSAAGQERNWAQELLDVEMAKYQMGVEAPWAAVNPYMRLIQGFDPGGTGTTTAPAAARGSVAQGALGGAIAGGLGGYGVSQLAGGGAWPLTIGGGLLGGLAGAL
jgi:hypothetical protein